MKLTRATQEESAVARAISVAVIEHWAEDYVDDPAPSKARRRLMVRLNRHRIGKRLSREGLIRAVVVMDTGTGLLTAVPMKNEEEA